MEEDEAKNRRHLKRWLIASGLQPRPEQGGFEVAFHGKFRDFDVRAWMSNGWLSLSIYILQLPPPGASRNRLMERIAEMNDDMSLLKYTKKHDVLALTTQYRQEHVDADTLGSLVAFIRDTAEAQYPSIFDTVRGVDTLEALEEAFKRPSLSAGGE